MFQKANNVISQTMGRKHYSCTASLCELAQTFRELEQGQVAESVIMNAQMLWKQAFGLHDAGLAGVGCVLAEILLGENDLERAESELVKCVSSVSVHYCARDRPLVMLQPDMVMEERKGSHTDQTGMDGWMDIWMNGVYVCRC